jgi:hypothetical protein
MKQRSRLLAFSLLMIALAAAIGTVGILQQPKVLDNNNKQTQTNTIPQQEVPSLQNITDSTSTSQTQVKQSSQQQNLIPSENEQTVIDLINETSQSNQNNENEQPLNYTFQISTDYGYFCNSGNAQDAIQKAIESLPERTSAANIYLEGKFDNLSHVCLSSNVNFVGPATLLGDDCYCMFWTNYSNLYPYPDYWYADYVSIYNVTFNNLHFSGNNTTIGIYGTYCNGQGWELLQNFNIINCEFEGFYRALCINPLNSTFYGNLFHNNSQSGLYFNFGADLAIYNNTFNSDNMTSEQPCGLMLFDVFDFCSVQDNTFNANEGSVGLGIISSRRGIEISENIFNGTPYAIDFVERPFYSSDITFLNNTGVSDFVYDEGTFYTISATSLSS